MSVEIIVNRTERKVEIEVNRAGIKGDTGKSAYQSYLDTTTDNPPLTEAEWSERAEGPQGEQGEQGPIGAQGPKGEDGDSAYQVWLDAGNTGTEQEFIDSLKGEKGDDGTTTVVGGVTEQRLNVRLGVNRQLFDKSKVVVSRMIRETTGKDIASVTVNHSGIIPLAPGETNIFLTMYPYITLSTLAFYDSSGNPIPPLNNQLPTVQPAQPYRVIGQGNYQIPTGAVSVAFNVKYGNRDATDSIMLEYCSPTATQGTLKQEYNLQLPDDIYRLKYNQGLIKSDFLDGNSVKVIDFFDGSNDDDAVENALAFTSDYPYRTIIFSDRQWNLSKAVVIPSNTTVIIDNCTLKHIDETFDNMFRGANCEIDPSNPYGYPLSITDLENVKIIGRGNAQLIGADVAKTGYNEVTQKNELMVGDRWGWRCIGISFVKATNIALKGFRMTQTKNWAISFDLSNKIRINDLQIFSDVKNGDGVDFRVGCYDAIIDNCYMSCSDDCIAFTNLPKRTEGQLSLNIPGGFPMQPTDKLQILMPIEQLYTRDITVTNCELESNYHGVIILAANGGRNNNINISNIENIGNETNLQFIAIYTGYGGGYSDNDIHDIRINDIRDNSNTPTVSITAKINNSWLNKIVNKGSGPAISATPEMLADVTVTNS